MRRLGFFICIGFLLVGCGGESHQDLRTWMQEQGKGVRGKLDPLPQVKPYEPFAYNAFDLPDPFRPRKVEPLKGSSKLAPDLNRRKEPLEAFPLESLQMVVGGEAKHLRAMVDRQETRAAKVKVA